MEAKTLARRTRKVRSVVGAIEVFRKKIAGKLVDRLAPYVEEGEDFAEALDLVHRVLQRRLRDQSDELGSAHRRHQAQQAVIQSPRQRRDEAAADLRSALVAVRQAATAEFGRAGSYRLLGLKGPTAHVRQTDGLLFQAKRVLDGLRSAPAELPPSRLRTEPAAARTRFDRDDWIATLREPLERLDRAQEDLILREHQRVKTGGGEKDAAAEQHAVLLAVKKVVEGFHALADKSALEGRSLFPRRRKRRRSRSTAADTRDGSRPVDSEPAELDHPERPPLRVVASGGEESA